MNSSKNKTKVNLMKKYEGAFNMTPVGKRIFKDIQNDEVISNFMNRLFIKDYKSKSINDNGDNEFDIKKINFIQRWWKAMRKIILLQKNIILYLYRKRIQKKKKDMSLCILNLYSCIIKIFYKCLTDNLKEINNKKNQHIKTKYYNKWIEITDKKIIFRKLVTKYKKMKNKNHIIHENKTSIMKEDKLKKYNKIKSFKTNKHFYKNQTFKTNKRLNNLNSNTTNTTVLNNSANKKLQIIKPLNKNSYIYFEKKKYNSILPDPSYSMSTLNPYSLTNKKIPKNLTNRIPLSNRNNSSKQLFKQTQQSPNTKNLLAKIKSNNKNISKFIAHKNNIKNSIKNKSNELKIKKSITNIDNNKITVLYNNFNNGNKNIAGFMNSTKIQKKNNNIDNCHNQKFHSTDLNKNSKINKKSYKKIYDISSASKKKNNSQKKLFVEWYTKATKKYILDSLVFYRKKEKIRNYFILTQSKLFKYALIKIFKYLTLSFYFQKYRNISKTLSIKKNILKNLMIYIFQKQKENFIKSQKINHAAIGVINNININNYINCTNTTINNDKLNNIISKNINFNKIKAITNNADTHALNNSLIHSKINSVNLEYSMSNIEDNNDITPKKYKFDNSIAQINQLKMVFNLLENRNLSNQNMNNKKFNVFKQWKNNTFSIINKISPKINEKIIILKSPHLSNISNIPNEKSSSFLSLEESNFKNYNILDYANNNNRVINNIYVNYGNEKKNKNHNVIKSFQSLLQENINNVSLNNNLVYYKKKLCLSNNKNNNLLKHNINNNVSFVCDSYNEPSNYFHSNINSFNISKDCNNNKLINHIQSDRYSLYNSNSYNSGSYNTNIYFKDSLNSDKKFEDIYKIKKINKIEEKEIFFVHKKNNIEANNNNGSSSNYNFKFCVTEHYNKDNGGNIDEDYSNTEFS